MDLAEIVSQKIEYWDAEDEKWVKDLNDNCTDIMLPKGVWAAVWRSMTQNEKRYNNLLRIITERANADRDLRPKKEHTGYLLLSSAERQIRPTTSLRITQAYDTVIQSPFPVALTPLEVAKEEICRAIFADGIGAKIGIEGRIKDLGIDQGEEVASYDVGKKNAVFAIKYRANCRDGYWEITLQHTKPLTAFPVDMLPEKSKNVEKSRK